MRAADRSVPATAEMTLDAVLDGVARELAKLPK
jgi:hypothetical protein